MEAREGRLSWSQAKSYQGQIFHLSLAGTWAGREGASVPMGRSLPVPGQALWNQRLRMG